MKKIIYIMMALSLLVGCKSTWLDESEHPMPDGVGGKAEFIFDGEPAVKVGKLGGEYSTKVRANRPWLIESTDEWIVVTSNRIGKGDGSEEIINFTVTKNPGLEPRSGKIRMWITNDD
ncbi:MAG: BACON domain-containing protein, partial [Bacteroidales bacterium]|nr:BACON domain-containing protein [Bacteroidales bacterium]